LHPEGTRGVAMEGAPPVANQIDLFMHFLGASRDGLVARRVDLDTISSSVCGLSSFVVYFNAKTHDISEGNMRIRRKI
jgi:hypothetical protein